jgi:hypothetical protein
MPVFRIRSSSCGPTGRHKVIVRSVIPFDRIRTLSKSTRDIGGQNGHCRRALEQMSLLRVKSRNAEPARLVSDVPQAADVVTAVGFVQLGAKLGLTRRSIIRSDHLT